MGSCLSKCYTEIRNFSCWQVKNNFDDTDRLMDFDMFLEEQPTESSTTGARPLSISSWLSCVRNQLGVENEEIELQEETIAEANEEALRISKLAENSTELMNPAKLALNTIANPNEMHPSENGNGEARYHKNSESHNSDKEDVMYSSPSSSVDLEWENEDGLSPVTHIPKNGDVSSDTASCGSQLSTPVSNGNEELEWDGHFTSTHISHLDMETEHLISEIERLTSSVLQDNDSNS